MPDIPQDSWAATTFLPVILTLGGVFLLFGLMNRQGGGANSKAMNFGKSRARPVSYTHLDVYKRQVYHSYLTVAWI